MGARRLPRTTQKPWAPAPDIHADGPPMRARGVGGRGSYMDFPGPLTSTHVHESPWAVMGRAVVGGRRSQGTCCHTARSATLWSPEPDRCNRWQLSQQRCWHSHVDAS